MLGRKAHAISPTTALNYGITRRRARRARPLRRGLQGVRHDGDAEARASRRTRASRTASSCSAACRERDRDHEARRRGLRGTGRAGGVDALPARQALLVDRPRRSRRAAEPRRAREPSPATTTRSTRSPGSRPRKGHYRAAIALEQQAVDADSAAAVRRRSSATSIACNGQPARGAQAVRAGRRDRAPARRERRQHRPRDGALRRRPRHPPARDALALARKARAERPSIDGDDVLAWALARNGRCGEALPLLAALAPARHARRPEALPPRHDRALPRPRRRRAQRLLRRALALNPHFSILWAPVARKALR